MKINSLLSNNLNNARCKGTLAIDLGSSNTIVAFQNERDREVELLDLSPISSSAGEVPSLIWTDSEERNHILFGNQVNELNLNKKKKPNLISDFKRWIGSPEEQIAWKSFLSPEKAGELLIKKIWSLIPDKYEIKRLVISVPVETYKEYRKWLYKVCLQLSVPEIALVDEPTAAAMGAGQKGGSTLLVIDIGGSTIDMSMVLLEGGEGQADPIAQLVRFNGEDIGSTSKQVLRCAKVLGKAGIRLGGRDFDRWITNHLCPENEKTELLLNTAERLKCKLSQITIPETRVLSEEGIVNESGEKTILSLSRSQLEDLLKEKGIIKSLEQILRKTLARGRANGYELTDLTGAVLVGGGAQMPFIKKWFEEKISPTKLLTPPPIEAVAIGALSLTPGVQIRDILHNGVSLRCWDQKKEAHIWHPIFVAGQPWPTTKDFEIILGASKKDQNEMEIQLADDEGNDKNEITYVNGIPIIKDIGNQHKIVPWKEAKTLIPLDPPRKQGEDCLKLKFSIDDDCNLLVKVFDIKLEEQILTKALGSLR